MVVFFSSTTIHPLISHVCIFAVVVAGKLVIGEREASAQIALRTEGNNTLERLKDTYAHRETHKNMHGLMLLLAFTLFSVSFLLLHRHPKPTTTVTQTHRHTLGKSETHKLTYFIAQIVAQHTIFCVPVTCKVSKRHVLSFFDERM